MNAVRKRIESCPRTIRVAGAIAVVLWLISIATVSPAWAGAYVLAGETNGHDLIMHPQGYTGTQSIVTVEVCIDPTTLVPAGAVITDLEIPIQNNVAIWNQLLATQANAVVGSANNVPAGFLDFESVALHELGHCIGLAHPNLASESGVTGNDTNYTKSSDGVPDGNSFNTPDYDLAPGPDSIRGTLDDVRGDDVNLHWFRTDTNNPGQLPLPSPVDGSTYARDLSALPVGHSYAQNLDRNAATTMGVPAITEAVMQQGTFSDEAQRTLTADDVATIRLAMSGIDETEGTADDYTLNLVYGGISNAPSCDLSLSFSNTPALAFCSITLAFSINSPTDTHGRIDTAFMEYGVGFNWFFNQQAAIPAVPAESQRSRATLTAALALALGGLLVWHHRRTAI